jgi:hypothetical protein
VIQNLEQRISRNSTLNCCWPRAPLLPLDWFKFMNRRNVSKKWVNLADFYSYLLYCVW